MISQPALMKITFPELFKPIENKENEEWRIIDGFDKYSVSNLGRVKMNSQIKSVYGIDYVDQEKLLVVHLNDAGIQVVRLCNNNISTSKSVMKLTANAFIRNLENDVITVPKDGNHSNCAVSNISIVMRGGYKGDGFWDRGFSDGY